MKKVFTTLLCAIMVISIAGCSSDKKEEKISGTDQSNESKSDEMKKIEVKESGYSTDEENDYLYYGVKVENPNKNYYIEFPTIVITAYAEDGSIITTEEQTLYEIAPNESLYYAGNVNIKNIAPAKVEFKAKTEKRNYKEKAEGIESKNFAISNVSELTDDYGTSFTGQIVNNSKKDCDTVAIVVILRNEDKIVGGDVTFVDSIPAGETSAFEVSSYKVIPHTSYETYALTW